MSDIFQDTYSPGIPFSENTPPDLDGANMRTLNDGIAANSSHIATLSSQLNDVEGIARSGGIIPRGDWDGSIAYTVKDMVYHEGMCYIAIANNTGVEPPDSNTWQIAFNAMVIEYDAEEQSIKFTVPT